MSRIIKVAKRKHYCRLIAKSDNQIKTTWNIIKHPHHHTTHGTPTGKKENRNSRSKRKNIKRRKHEKTATTTYIRSTHAEKSG
jgi:nickel-dependent lactate racemase